jgi:hypothetical protein
LVASGRTPREDPAQVAGQVAGVVGVFPGGSHREACAGS